MLSQHLEKLRVFAAVAQDGSMVRASRRLHVSQPAVSKAVRGLEAALGRDLFVRSSSGLALTPEGKRLLEFSESLFLRVVDLEQSMVRMGEVAGVVRIGTYESLGEILWPEALSRLRKAHPGLRVELETEGTRSVWERLRSGAVDLIVDAEPQPARGFVSRVLYKDRFQVFKSSKRTEGEPPSFAYVEAAVDRDGVGIREHLLAHGIEHRLSYAVQSFTLARALAVKGLCHAVLPSRLGGLEPLLIRGKPVFFGEHRVCATVPESSERNPRIEAVVGALKAAFDERP